MIFQNHPEEDEQNTICQSAPSNPSIPSNWAMEKNATNKLLLWFGKFIYRRCFRIIFLTPDEPVCWIRSVERALILAKWQTEQFLIPSNVIFLYLICREVISSRLQSKKELQKVLMMCLYVSYSFMGPEISYPVKFFRGEGVKEDFWDKCVAIIGALSGKMMRINTDPVYYARTFEHLKSEGDWR